MEIYLSTHQKYKYNYDMFMKLRSMSNIMIIDYSYCHEHDDMLFSIYGMDVSSNCCDHRYSKRVGYGVFIDGNLVKEYFEFGVFRRIDAFFTPERYKDYASSIFHELQSITCQNQFECMFSDMFLKKLSISENDCFINDDQVLNETILNDIAKKMIVCIDDKTIDEYASYLGSHFINYMRYVEKNWKDPSDCERYTKSLFEWLMKLLDDMKPELDTKKIKNDTKLLPAVRQALAFYKTRKNIITLIQCVDETMSIPYIIKANIVFQVLHTL